MNTEPVRVYKDRTTRITASLGFDVSDEVITSEIRSEAGELIVPWTIVNDGDGTDGEVVMTIDNALTTDILAETGLMDFKRLSGGEPLPLINAPIEVVFVKAVTQ